MSKLKFLTPEIIEELPELINDFLYTDGEFNNLKYVGFCAIKVAGNNIIVLNENFKNIFTEEDLIKIKTWLPTTKGSYYNDYYRIDLKNYIFLFQFYISKGYRILLGNLLIKDFETRLELASMQQEFFLKERLHGSTYDSIPAG